MLFDAWALTTIREKLPGRPPPVEPYLHGISEAELPETQVAWREEVQHLSGEDFAEERDGVLAAYPLLAQELLREPSYRAIKYLETLGKRNPDHHAWILSDIGNLSVVTLKSFTDKDNKESINGMTVLLDPRSGGLNASGMLDGTSETADDVSATENRCRLWDDDDAPEGFHEVCRVGFSEEDEESEPRTWYWFARRNTGEPTAKKPVEWSVHVDDVERELRQILSRLSLDETLQKSLRIAAKFHDHGKRRAIFQQMLGNRNFPAQVWAKSGKKRGTRLQETYRHEFGSLHDVSREAEWAALSDSRSG